MLSATPLSENVRALFSNIIFLSPTFASMVLKYHFFLSAQEALPPGMAVYRPVYLLDSQRKIAFIVPDGIYMHIDYTD
ncbi:hypothetical protein BDP27DRAFT_364151 [Rhodocollybia butyracea]|uniref:Uncharacterized protein n=1 Tax=Rhodocollybia butyracea TaxID=206335 RepID=A0A9P5PDU1_9AGAR|nr:hypothetical protein BDP27DRAFT_364151 [Rhodocollybia butyracea]